VTEETGGPKKPKPQKSATKGVPNQEKKPEGGGRARWSDKENVVAINHKVEKKEQGQWSRKGSAENQPVAQKLWGDAATVGQGEAPPFEGPKVQVPGTGAQKTNSRNQNCNRNAKGGKKQLGGW